MDRTQPLAALFVAGLAFGCAFEVDDFCSSALDCERGEICNQNPSAGVVNACITDPGSADMGSGRSDMGPGDSDMGPMPVDMGPRDMAAPVDECEERLDDCGPNATCVD